MILWTLVLAAVVAAVPPSTPKAEVCAKCHGADGVSSDPAIPSLAGQREEYLAMQLVQYREGRRKSAQMLPFAQGLSDADVEELARYYAAQKPFASRRAGDAAKVAAGKKVAEANHCGSCHLPDLSGQKHVPRLVGQNYAYLLEQMKGFKDQTRADIDGSMSMAAQPLSARDIEEVSEYVASLRAGK